MFSAAVSSPSRLGSWNTMPKARRTKSGSLTGSWPAIESRPSLGVSTVVSILIVVVLPAPLGPRKPKMTPSGTANEIWSTAVKPSKALDQVAGLDDRSHHFTDDSRGRPCMVILSQPSAQVVICQILHYEPALKQHFRY